MSKININDDWLTDPRRFELGERVGCVELADGVVLAAWLLALEFWKYRRLIPKPMFMTLKNAEDLLATNLAVTRGNLVYVRGTTKRHTWLPERLENASKGGRSRKSLKSGQNEGKQNASKLEANAKQTRSKTQATYTYTDTHTYTHTDTEEKEKSNTTFLAEEPKSSTIQAAPESTKTNEVAGVYFDLYKAKYSGKAPLTGKHFSLLKNLVKAVGVDRSKDLIRGYFEMPDAYFVKRRHDVETLNANLNQVAHFVDTGTIITNRQARAADDQMTNLALLKQFEEEFNEK